MSYADYKYYTEQYCGGMPEEAFLRLAVKASAYLDQVTRGRIASGGEDRLYSDRISMACCAVADALLRSEAGGDIASESNDGVSVTYAKAVKDENRRLYDAAFLYLSQTGLLCWGV